MPDRLFLVHGMGYDVDGWHKQAVEFLGDFCDRFGPPGPKKFGDRFKVVGIVYDDVFRDILATWKSSSAEVLALGKKFDAPTVERILGWSQNAPGTDNNFLWSHAVDVVLYRLFPTVRDAVKVHVASRIAAELTSLKAGESWSIIAHSLGTIVTHDTLHAWYTEPLGAAGQLGYALRPKLVTMLANVSRILQTTPEVLGSDSTVRPGQACLFYLNTFHHLDPFTFLRPFTPDQWPDPDKFRKGDYRLVLLDHIQQVNIHDLLHYLKHPDLVTALFRTLLYQSFISKQKEEQYRASFKQFDDLTEEQVASIRRQLEGIEAGATGTGEDWELLLGVRRAYAQAIGQGGAS
jgi:hypothetical protein